MERDDLIINDSYSIAAQHDEETGRAVRKRIIKTTIILSLITAAEVLMGIFIKHGSSLWPVVKWSFIVMTIIKAAYIVSVFMHLGDERRNFRYFILIPYLIFALYIVYILLTESVYIHNIWNHYMPEILTD